MKRLSTIPAPAVAGVAGIDMQGYTDEGYCLTDKAGNTLEDQQGYRCKLTVADGIVVYRE